MFLAVRLFSERAIEALPPTSVLPGEVQTLREQ
jgi:hypothetical protein